MPYGKTMYAAYWSDPDPTYNYPSSRSPRDKHSKTISNIFGSNSQTNCLVLLVKDNIFQTLNISSTLINNLLFSLKILYIAVCLTD